jgi:thymidine phosphorylase
MDVPLGFAVGNAIEVAESVEVLAGGGPSDVVELTLLLAREMLDLAGITGIDPADTLRDGSAMDVWRRMVSAQGGDPAAPLPTAREHHVVRAEADGVVTRMDALGVGIAAWRLGAGRARKEDPVSAGAGILLHAKPGDPVAAGAPLMTLMTDDEARFAGAQEALVGAVEVGPAGSRIDRLPLVIDRLT